MNIDNIFDHIEGKRQEMSDKTIAQFQGEWNLPLSAVELDELKKNDTQPSHWNEKTYGAWKPRKFERWTFPKANFPQAFIELMKGYSGCSFSKEAREFSIFGPDDLREMNIAYELPEYMVGAVSFGLDGAGNHLVFDMRANDSNQAYKIYGVHSGYLEWEGAKLLANSFEEFINGGENIDEMVNG